MADTKTSYKKCSICKQIGHNKRKCPTQMAEAAPSKVETKPKLEKKIYMIAVEQDNGDDVSRYYVFYETIDGLVKGLEEVITNIKEEQKDLEDEEDQDEEDQEDEEEKKHPYSYIRHLLYHSKKESFKDVPIPTKEFIEAFLEKSEVRWMNGLMIEAGPMRSAACFACNIYVTKQTLRP